MQMRLNSAIDAQGLDDKESDTMLESGSEVLRDAIKPPSSRSEVDNTLEGWFNKKRTVNPVIQGADKGLSKFNFTPAANHLNYEDQVVKQMSQIREEEREDKLSSPYATN